jgi:hypothetical protein
VAVPVLMLTVGELARATVVAVMVDVPAASWTGGVAFMLPVGVRELAVSVAGKSPDKCVTVAAMKLVADAVGKSPDKCVTVAAMKLVADAVGIRPGAEMVGFALTATCVLVAVPVPDASARLGPTCKVLVETPNRVSVPAATLLESVPTGSREISILPLLLVLTITLDVALAVAVLVASTLPVRTKSPVLLIFAIGVSVLVVAAIACHVKRSVV